VPCRGTTHVKLIILRITTIADFEQRWPQRGNTMDSSLKKKLQKGEYSGVGYRAGATSSLFSISVQKRFKLLCWFWSYM